MLGIKKDMIEERRMVLAPRSLANDEEWLVARRWQ